MNDSHNSNPIAQLADWLAEARERRATPNSNAMSLATVAHQRGEILPSSRIVLCKDVNVEHGYLVFYTNYESRKAAELEQTGVASVVFHWDTVGRQARVEGRVVPSPASESDAYFASRPRGSQLSAWASEQSQPIGSREELLAQLESVTKRFSNQDVPRPPHWGGYRIWASAVELWTEGEYRVHDRVRWVRTLGVDEHGGIHPDQWAAVRLQP